MFQSYLAQALLGLIGIRGYVKVAIGKGNPPFVSCCTRKTSPPKFGIDKYQEHLVWCSGQRLRARNAGRSQEET